MYNIHLYTRYVVVNKEQTSILITWEDIYKFIDTITPKDKEVLYQYASNCIHVVNDVFDYFDSDSYFQLRCMCRMFDILCVADEAKKVLRLKHAKDKKDKKIRIKTN